MYKQYCRATCYSAAPILHFSRCCPVICCDWVLDWATIAQLVEAEIRIAMRCAVLCCAGLSLTARLSKTIFMTEFRLEAVHVLLKGDKLQKLV
jgi:hypothetical protein